MRHGVSGKKLSRDTGARRALLNNLASAILINGQVTTTLAKVRFAKSHVENLVTIARKNKLSRNRFLASALGHEAFLKLINEVGPTFKERSGGYTRIVKLAPRRGDSSPMARLEFVERFQKDAKPPKKEERQKEAVVKKGEKVTRGKSKAVAKVKKSKVSQKKM